MKAAQLAARFAGMAALGGTVTSNAVAWRLGHQAALGSPLLHYKAWPIYAPWDILAWAPWHSSVPAIHLGLLVAAGITALPLVGIIKRLDKPEFGKKEWGTAADAKAAGLLSGDPSGGVAIAKICGKVMTFSGDQHTLFAGASGSGKSAGPVVCTLLSSRDRSMLVFDPKGELYKMTAQFRSRIGQALFFDPTEVNSARFNPLAEIAVGSTREIADVQNIAGLLVDACGLKNDTPIWPITATDLLTALILYAVHSAPVELQHMGALRDMMFDLDTTLQAMAACPHPESHRIAVTMLTTSDKIADSIALTARSALSVWADPLVVEKTRTSDFKISDLVCAKYPMSLYLQVPPSDRDRVMPLFRLMLLQVFKAFLRKPGHMADGRKKLHRLQLVADEFPAVGKIPGFAQDIQEFRGYGVSCMLLCQTLKSLEEVYGKTQVIRENCHVVTCFASSDPESMSDISKAVGTGIGEKTSKTHRRGEWFGGGSTSTSEDRRPLLDPGDVRKMDMDEALVLVTGTKPIKARKIRWFEMRAFRNLAVNLWKHPDAPLVQNPEIMKMRAKS